MTGGLSKEYGTNKPPLTGRIWERSKGDSACPSTSQNPSLWHPSWLSGACATRKDSESGWLTKNNPETNLITIKPETVSHLAEQLSWAPFLSCSPPGRPFPIKSLALSARVSPWTVHVQVLDKSPVSGPGRGLLSCNSGVLLYKRKIHMAGSGSISSRHLVAWMCSEDEKNEWALILVQP